jgi:hypothetical protein
MPKGKYKRKVSQGFQKGHKLNVGNKFSLGFKHTAETRKKLSIARLDNQCAKGAIRSKEHREIISKAQSGSNHWNWKGGLAKDKRTGKLYSQWRSDVFTRDNWTCQTCGTRSSVGIRVYLEAHHIKSWSEYPKLRYKLDNGVTLCKECHKLTDNYKGKNNGLSENVSLQENKDDDQENTSSSRRNISEQDSEHPAVFDSEVSV